MQFAMINCFGGFARYFCIRYRRFWGRSSYIRMELSHGSWDLALEEQWNLSLWIPDSVAGSSSESQKLFVELKHPRNFFTSSSKQIRKSLNLLNLHSLFSQFLFVTPTVFRETNSWKLTWTYSEVWAPLSKEWWKPSVMKLEKRGNN